MTAVNFAHDAESEAALLGALLIDERAFDVAADLFDPAYFHHQHHAAVAAACVRLHRKRTPIDPVTLVGELRDDERAELTPHVFALSKGCGTGSNVRHYAERVRALWAERQVQLAAKEYLDDGRADVPAAVKIARLASKVTAAETGKGAEWRSSGDMMAELVAELQAEAEEPAGSVPKRVVPTGFTELDLVTGGVTIGKPHLYAGRPGGGKSALAVGIGEEVAKRGVPVGVFWKEDDWRAAAKRQAARRALIPATLLRHGKNLSGDHWGRLYDAVEQSKNWPLFLDDSKGQRVTAMCAEMRRVARLRGVRLFLVDHLGELPLDDDALGDRGDEKLGNAFRALRDTSESLGAGLIAFHQLKREADKGALQLGLLYNSAQLEHIARVVGFVSYEARSFTVYLPKNQDGPRDVRVSLGWDPETRSVFDPRML